uniref:Uncharacterized protein n=1 Tax=Lepeophtheirus salmonis TaxID=72036 RepID=A0A0K2UXZ1_LEPSM
MCYHYFVFYYRVSYIVSLFENLEPEELRVYLCILNCVIFYVKSFCIYYLVYNNKRSNSIGEEVKSYS